MWFILADATVNGFLISRNENILFNEKTRRAELIILSNYRIVLHLSAFSPVRSTVLDVDERNTLR